MFTASKQFLRSGAQQLDSALCRLLGVVVLGYRRLVSPFLPAACRFSPSCSVYAMESLRVHPLRVALGLIVRRLSRCHPWGGQGFDPVPGPLPALRGDCCGASAHPDPCRPAAGRAMVGAGVEIAVSTGATAEVEGP